MLVLLCVVCDVIERQILLKLVLNVDLENCVYLECKYCFSFLEVVKKY